MSGRRTDPATFDIDPIAIAAEEMIAFFDSETAKQFKPKARCLVNLYLQAIYDERGNQLDQQMCGRPVLAEMPIGFYDHLRTEAASRINSFYFGPLDGRSIIISRTGSGKNNTEYKYGIHSDSPRGPIIPDVSALMNMLAGLPDLAQLARTNCERDKPKWAEAAQKIREWGMRLKESRGAMFNGMQAATQGWAPPAMPAPAAPIWTPAAPQAAPPAAPQGWAPPPPPPPQAPVWTPPAPPAPPPPAAPQMAPQGWAPSPPPAAVPAAAEPPKPTGKPHCYKGYIRLNGADPAARDNPTNEECKTCAFRVPCQFESTM